MTSEPSRRSMLRSEYDVAGEIGRGEGAVVYRARDRELGREVALKIAAAAGSARLRHEASVLGRLQHPHIPTLYGARRAGSGHALILQLVSGCTLRELLRRGGVLSPERAAAILASVGAALAHAHARGVIHGAVTPDAILIEETTDRAFLIGFGAATVIDAAAAHSTEAVPTDPAPHPPVPAGARAYFAPERRLHDRLDVRGDLYSLGLTGYEMLTGTQPLEGTGYEGAPLLPLALVRPEVPDPLRIALEGALRDMPAERWLDVGEFLDALAGRIGERGRVLRRRVPSPPPFWRRASRGERRRLGAAAVALVAVAGLLAAAALRPWAADAEFRAFPRELPFPDRNATGAEAPAASPYDAAGARAPYDIPGSGSAPAEALEMAAGPAGEPALVYALFGDAQYGVAGDTLPEQLVLRVEDTAGRAVAGVRVYFTVTAGESRLGADSVVTNEFGLASTWWLPSGEGMHEVEAKVPPLVRAHTFRARVASTSPEPAVAAAPARGETAGAPAPAALPTARGSTPAPAAAGGARESAPALAVSAGLALGGTHSCLLRRDGQAYCWGSNDHGQLGVGTAARSATPAPVAASEPFAALAAGVSHSCAVARTGLLYCWGSNGSGQLGDGTTANRARPTRVAGERRFQSVAAGLSHTCGLAADAGIYCWGANGEGQLGDGSTTTRTRPVRAGEARFRALAVGWGHTCGLTMDGAAYCWGRNSAGELGDGTTGDRSTPTLVSGGHRFVAIAAGSYHTCGLRGDGVALCWGQNSFGQLGSAQAEPALAPRPVAGIARYAALALGGVHGCALTREGAVHCWGRNAYGQLGDGSTRDRATPGPVVGGLRFAALQASGAHTCGTTTDGREFCWGYNADGQLGTGGRVNQNRPTPVAATW